MKKEDFFSKLENKCLNDEDIERTKDIIRKIKIKNGEKSTELYCKSDVSLLACVFEKFVKVLVNEIAINSLYRISPPGYTWQCGLK